MPTLEKVWQGLWQVIIGRPLRSREASAEQVSVPEGLAALALDALSSVAYGPEAIAVVLVGAGAAAMRQLLVVILAIVALLLLLVLSYSQVIEAYPNGGGAYAVARANLGRMPSLVAAASLVVDYILTVSVSVAAGVALMASAFPVLLPYTLPLCLAVVAFITILNLRGVGESARAFLLPTVAFVGGMWISIIIGFTHADPIVVTRAPMLAGSFQTLGILLLLKAFSSGCTALTGVEAIANGVPLFREPRVRRAKSTMRSLGVILASILIGVAFLTLRYHLLPRTNVMLLAQVLEGAVGRSWLFYLTSFGVTAALGLAANTSFGSLPLLSSVLARDHYLPHVFAIRGDRLVFETGIWMLALASSALLVFAHGDTQTLIPLYAIGVFTGFTLSQAGLVRHWLRERLPGWRWRALLNGLGAVATGLATLIFIYGKFREGAWIVVIAIPLLIWMFLTIAGYYRRLGELLHPVEMPRVIARPAPVVLVPVTPDLNTLAARALAHALAISTEVLAVTVIFDPEPGQSLTEEQVQERWQAWNTGVRLVVLHSQFHSVVRPLVRFISSLERREGSRILVLIPEVIATNPLQGLLHNRMGRILRRALERRTDVVVGTVPMHVGTRQILPPIPPAPPQPPSPRAEESAPGHPVDPVDRPDPR
ncbi:MAG: APC family permease [Clostridia bacterium]